MNQNIDQIVDDLKTRIITLEWDIAHIHNNRLLQIKKQRLEECKEELLVLLMGTETDVLGREKPIIAS